MIWRHGIIPMKGITITCGDCLREMRDIVDGSVGLIVTSPPYNLRNSTGNGMKGSDPGGLWKKPKLAQGYSDTEDNMPHDEYVAWQRECLTEMLRLIPETGAIFYNHKWRVQGGILQDRADIVAGFPVRQVIIWDRTGGLNFNRGYFLPTYEVIYLIAKPGFKLRRDAVKQGDIWRFPPEKKNPHPAPFPLELAERCIGATDAGSVLDPFMGSGTTLLAAKRLGRTALGIDSSQEYCDMAWERLGNA